MRYYCFHCCCCCFMLQGVSKPFMVFRDDRSLVGPTLITTIYLVLFRHMGFFIRQRRDIKMKPLHTHYDGLRFHLSSFSNQYLTSDPGKRSVEENWHKISETIHEAMDKYIPHRMSKAKRHLPWVSASVKRMMNRAGSSSQGKRDVLENPKTKLHINAFAMRLSIVVRLLKIKKPI